MRNYFKTIIVYNKATYQLYFGDQAAEVLGLDRNRTELRCSLKPG